MYHDFHVQFSCTIFMYISGLPIRTRKCNITEQTVSLYFKLYKFYNLFSMTHVPKTDLPDTSPRPPRGNPERVNILRFYETVPEMVTFPIQSPNALT
jgi:hypothetical protein